MNQINNIPELKQLRKDLRNNLTPAEIKLWKCLQNKQLCGRKFRRQHSIGSFIIDFYCPSEKIAIELDGQIHFNPINENYDFLKDEYLKSIGINVLRFENNEIFDNIDNVLGLIKFNFK